MTETTSTSEPAALMSWPDLLGRPKPETRLHVRFGEGETDVIDLWLPDGEGPHPTVIMIHGGCWQKSIADRTLMNYAAEDLRTRGIAVWNIEYRGVDEDGGGYPGTFLDVARAADMLTASAEEFNLKTDKVVAYGHSAGGHLAAWLSTRPNLLKSSPMYIENPLPISAVVNSGGLADLEASEPVTLDSCLAKIMDDLTGAPSQPRPNVFSDTSPPELFPSAAKHISINGDQDRIAPGTLGMAYTARAIQAGMSAEIVVVDNSGHVELIAPGTAAFDKTAEIIEDLLK